jgi:acyl-ACP thioesterase
LLRLAVEMDIFPKLYSEIYVETWVEEVGRATTVRNFQVLDAESKIIGKASSIWAMIDLTTRKALDLIALEGIGNFANYEKVDMDKPIKLQAVDSDTFNSFKVSYNDIDINFHTNSLSYVKWVSNCFSLDDYSRKMLSRFEINYISEIFFADEVSIHMKEIDPNDYRFEIRANGKNSCRARVVFK